MSSASSSEDSPASQSMSSMSESETVSGTRVAVEVTADMVGGVITSGRDVDDLEDLCRGGIVSDVKGSVRALF